MNCLNSPLLLLPSQFLGMKSLIPCCFGTGFAVTHCIAPMAFNMSNLPLTVCEVAVLHLLFPVTTVAEN